MQIIKSPAFVIAAFLLPLGMLFGEAANTASNVPTPVPEAEKENRRMPQHEYKAALIHQVLSQPNGRWQRMVDSVLNAPNPPPDGKYLSIGRGEVAYMLPLALAGSACAKSGDAQNAARLSDAALRTLRVCNRVAVDHYYAENEEGEGGNRGQISFVMPEVAETCRILKEQGTLRGEDLERTRRMLEAIVDHRMRIMPEIGMGGMTNWINRGGLGALRAANFLESEWKSDPEFAKARPDLPEKIAKMRAYGVLPLKYCLDCPYHFRILPDGKISGAIKVEGRPSVESPAPAGRTPQFGINEDSSGYGVDAVGNLLKMIQEAPGSLVPELDAARMKQLCGWMQNWRAMLLPGGPMPSYGDAHWTGQLNWAAVFETAATMFGDTQKFGPAAADFRAAAKQIFDYCSTTCPSDAEALANLVECSKSQVGPAALPQVSRIVQQQNMRGDLQPGKIILHGAAKNPLDEPYAMLGTFAGGSHSHADFGCVIAYSRGPSVFVHEGSYDAGDMYFHQLPLVCGSDESFFPFHLMNGGVNDPKGTEIRKGNKNLPGGRRSLVSANLEDHGDYSVTRIVTKFDIKIAKNPLVVTFIRQALLEKSSGILIVYDAVTNDGGYRLPFKFSPSWHAQKILDRTPEGFLCKDDCQNIISPDSPTPAKAGLPSPPYWIGMKGQPGSKPSALTWRFLTKGHKYEMPQSEHIWLENVVSPGKGETSAVVTVFVPMPVGTSKIQGPPAQTEIAGTNATVKVAGRTYNFTPEGVKAGL